MVHASNPDIQLILTQVDLRDPMGPRDFNAITLMQHTGLRVNELCSLDVFDVSPDGREARHELYVRPAIAKGGNSGSHAIPLNSAARQAIARQLDFQRRRGFSTQPGAPLFTSKAHNRLTTRALQYVVKELRERARLAKPVTCHSFRRNFGTNLAATSGLRVAQTLLRHRRLNTVAIYTEVLADDLAAAVERLTE